MVDQPRTAYTTCPLCEATCGLELTVSGDRLTRVRGDADDVLSHGFICPKGASFGELDADPDRLRTPRIRRDGALVPAGWDEAFSAVDAGLTRIISEHGRDAVAIYLGNPNVHTLAGNLYAGLLRKALGSRNVYTASTLDQMPKHVSCGYLFGGPFAIPVPDIDRTDFLVILGADPYSSNGSLWTVPDAPGRLKALRARGGRFVVVDPRRSRTAQAADQYVPIRPGTDVFLLLGMVNALFGAGLVKPGRLSEHVNGVDAVRDLVAPFTPEAMAARCGVDAATIRELTAQLAAAPRAAVYGRIGTTTVACGTVTSWLVDVLNILTGNLDRAGGAMFPLPAHSRRGKGTGPGFTTGRWRSRVRGLPEVLGEFPAVTLADEIETPGEGQVRALVTVAGNPASSVPNADRLSRAISTLDFVVSVDPYVNETSRHADVILPPPPPSRGAHYDVAFYGFAVRNVANFSPPVLPLDGEMRDECEIYLRLMAIFAGLGWRADVEAWQDGELRQACAKLGADPALLTGDTAAERLVDLRLRTGAYGDGFGRVPDGLNLARLREQPHGVDLGPLTPRIPEILRTPSGRIELCPQPIADEVRALAAAPAPESGDFVVVGRRHLRSNNSWMHNVPALVKGRELCTVVVNRADAARLGLVNGGKARVSSRVGRVELTVEVTDDIAPGVVSIPHGWGHDLPGVELSVAAGTAGVNANRLTDDLRVDPLSGTAVLNGVPVTVEST
ncbi:molybdopterin-dependent oxidoreductase [Planosporangium flavigriseum]|uniref:Molybdopterin-binding oxidoreductase n=1 Tax=Planosporangium flavigriseum TaxID=373681 RepID=A0A8J3PP54_9ACTN|nr:molybdopterin oxidoreductase family protein [Planosporangium flavigriseum]NJC67794.1 molybdopterin-dependent oxidoreductase [Planosporangium flavigriseum]GIG76039.1 molybdopterin-binding oxidoreductase [Planosporangium flavigriseum]